MSVHRTAEIHKSAQIGKDTQIWHHSQIRENVTIGKNCIIGKNVYIDFGITIGNNVKIQNNCSLYHGLTIKDGVFIGPHTIFTNDKIPRAINPDGTLKGGADWKIGEILVKYGASIGAGCIILPGITIGKFCLIGSGSIVTKNIDDYALGLGTPFNKTGYICKCGDKLDLGEKCKTCNVLLDKKGNIFES